MTVEGYRELLHEDMENAVKAGSGTLNEEFLLYVAGILMNGEEFDDFVECSYKGISRSRGSMEIHGYAMEESDNSCCVFISLYQGPDGSGAIVKSDIDDAVAGMKRFIEDSIRYELYSEIRSSAQAKEFSSDLHYGHEDISKYRFYVVTDAENRQQNKTIKDIELDGKLAETNVWDIHRLYDLVCSTTQKESVEIDIREYDCDGIPCVKAVEYANVIADIDIIKTPDTEDEKPGNLISYTSYLAAVPGSLLNTLYLEYGSKLLEGNVRSFLSTKGKVNTGIKATILNYPEMFFAYNNGIAATATEIETEMTSEGLKIVRIKDLQIVNGGQTTASIANTFIHEKKGSVRLESLSVPMKVSVLEHEMSEKIIPKISQYSNSQNKVDASDFFSNHPFHVRMEDYSRKTPVPSVSGLQFSQYWFYERARGQYNQGKMKFAAKSSALRQYEQRYPKDQVITMLDLARYMMLYESRPDIVGKGRQKIMQLFSEGISKNWDTANEKYNAFYYKRVVALAIVFKRMDALIKETTWYKEKKSYKANVIAYGMAVLFNYIHKSHKDYEIDFLRIWNNQNTYPELDEQLLITAKEVYDFITGPRETENVTEWCKKELCWNRAKNHDWTITDGFIYSLVEKEKLIEENKTEVQSQKVSNEIDLLTEIFNRGTSYWKQVLQWGKTKGLLNEKEISILTLIVNMEYTGRIPSEKQAQVVANARERLISEGMPLQF